MKLKHTKGPWTAPFVWDQNKPFEFTVSGRIGGTFMDHIVSMDCSGPNGIDEERKANIQLISAAPQLLDSALGLEAFLTMFDQAGFEALKKEPEFFKLMNLVRTAKKLNDEALKKARGE